MAEGPKTLPIEVIYEILLLLSVETLLRMKTVSKEWLGLIQDPDFVKNHFRKHLRFPLPLKEKIQKPVYFGVQKDLFVSLSTSSGLLLQRSVASSKYFIRNPATRQVLHLPDPHKPSLSMTLTYVLSRGEHKVVNVYGEPSREKCEVLNIGNHGDLTWKRVELPDFAVPGNIGGRIRTLKSKRATHFFRQVTVASISHILVHSLDLETDTSSVAIVPTWFGSDFFKVRPFYGEDGLVLGSIDKHKKVMSVLLLKDHKQGNWSGPIVCDLNGLDCADIGVLIPYCIRREYLWFFWKPEKVIQYNAIAKKVVNIEIPGEGESFLDLTYINFPSLMSLRGMQPDTNQEI